MSKKRKNAAARRKQSKRRNLKRGKPRAVHPDFHLTTWSLEDARKVFGDRPDEELTVRMVMHRMIKAKDSDDLRQSEAVTKLADPAYDYQEALRALGPNQRAVIEKRGYRIPEPEDEVPSLSDQQGEAMIREALEAEGTPDWPTLRLIAARMLDKNPKLAEAMESGDAEKVRASIRNDLRIPALVNRQRLDQESTSGITAQFSEHGFNGIAYSMASQFRHIDWVGRDVEEPLPDGPTRTFHHFTSTVHLPVILRYGLARGDVCVEPGNELKNYNAPWLTTDGSFEHQGWAETSEGRPNSTFDKRAVRLTVAIPEGDPDLSTWAEVIEREGVPDFWAEAMKATGGNGDKDWFIYNNLIPRAWITEIAYRYAPALLTGRYGILRVADLLLT